MNKQDLIDFEAEVAEKFKRKEIHCPIHLGSGNEQILIDIFKNIDKNNYIFATHRNHLSYLLHTEDKEGLEKKILAGDSMHTYSPKHHFYSSSIVAGCVAIACGVALALKIKDSSNKVYCFVGDAATDEGFFSEAVKYATTMDLPILYIIENNNRSVGTSIEQRWGAKVEFHTNSKVMVYNYICGYPHAGCGEWVTF